MPFSEVKNCDCLPKMKEFPDNFFDLAICDPPYGIGEDGKKNHSRGNLARVNKYIPKTWDRQIPDLAYFINLKRISKHQIIWGGNYFPLGKTSCYIVWDKENGNNDFADAELAWTNFKSAVRIFKFKWNGMLQGDMKNKEKRIHPTQKPVKLYKWLLHNYAKAGDKILDTHMGSQSSRIACYDMGFDYWGFELDKDYFNAGNKRFEQHISQQTLNL